MNLEIRFKNIKYSTDKTFNTPTCDEVAAILPEDYQDDQKEYENIHLVCTKTGNLKQVKNIISHYDPLHYTLMFPYGQPGWQYNTYPKANKKDEYITAMQYYAYMLQNRKS